MSKNNSPKSFEELVRSTTIDKSKLAPLEKYYNNSQDFIERYYQPEKPIMKKIKILPKNKKEDQNRDQKIQSPNLFKSKIILDNQTNQNNKEDTTDLEIPENLTSNKKSEYVLVSPIKFKFDDNECINEGSLIPDISWIDLKIMAGKINFNMKPVHWHKQVQRMFRAHFITRAEIISESNEFIVIKPEEKEIIERLSKLEEPLYITTVPLDLRPRIRASLEYAT